MTPGCLPSVRCSTLRSSGNPSLASCHVREIRSPHRFAHRGMSRRPNVEGDESEVRYPAAEERGLAATNRAAGRMLLTDFCNHPLQNENPKIVRFSSARLSPGRLRARDPNALKRTEHRVHGALTHLAARQPRVEGRLTTRFQLRLARHRPRHRVDARMRAARTLPLVTAFSATNEVAQAQSLTPLSPDAGPDTRRHREADERPEPIPSPSRQCERSTPAQDAFHRRGGARKHTACAMGRSAPDNGPIGLATDDPTSDAFLLPARRIANEISGGARPDRGKQALRLRAWQAIRRLSTSAIETNYEHDTRSAEPRTQHEEANLDELRFDAGERAGKSTINRVAPGQGHQRRRSGRCRFLQDRSRRKIRPNPDGSNISCRDCATTWVGETRAVRTRSSKPHARKRNHRAKPKLHR